MRRIIALSGFAQSGKDSVGKILAEKYGFEKFALADAIRDGVYGMNPIVTWKLEEPSMLKQFFAAELKVISIRTQEIVDEIGWDRAKTEYPEIRHLIQTYGTEAGRNVHGDRCWTTVADREFENNPDTNYFITDVRFPNELEFADEKKAFKVLVKRPGITSVNGHASDAGLPVEDFNALIHNDGTLEDLEDKVTRMMTDLGIQPIDRFPDSAY